MTVTHSTQTVNQALILHPGGSFTYEERPKPTLQSDRDVIVKVIATGLCGSDVHYWQHGRLGRYIVSNPLILGHESTGIITETGANTPGLNIGDRIALEPGIACNACTYCRSGRYNLCTSMRFAATPPIDGTLATYYRVPAECVYKLPGHVSLRDGTLIEPLSVAVHGCRLGGSGSGGMQEKAVVVFGAGPVGLLCCGVARAFGASVVVVVDVVAERLEVARGYGATHSYEMGGGLSLEENVAGVLGAAGLSVEEGGRGVDVVLDATGAEPCVTCGIHVLSAGGTFVQVGLGKPSLSLPVGQICDKEIVFKGSFRYGPGDFELAVGLLESGRIKVDGLVTHEFGFERAEEAFRNVVGRNGIKSVIYGPGVDEDEARELA
ncbi:chaperonin 10-like protein [Aspergillus cavernicola]|uniref:Chaperonin 10-like protein n=1 Tax=Aspergillus cavernicola TaxID=176166 RepID=A0ABR4IXY6_9EURO